MVDLLKKPAFRREFFPEFEAEKETRAKSLGIAPERGLELWKPDDPRWNLKPPFGFVRLAMRFGGFCVYCAEQVKKGSMGLYSAKLHGVAHVECHADFDGQVKLSDSDRL
jgi:hypothetical protein